MLQLPPPPLTTDHPSTDHQGQGLCWNPLGLEPEARGSPRPGVPLCPPQHLGVPPRSPGPAEPAQLHLRAAPKLSPALPGRLEISAQQPLGDFNTAQQGAGRGAPPQPGFRLSDRLREGLGWVSLSLRNNNKQPAQRGRGAVCARPCARSWLAWPHGTFQHQARLALVLTQPAAATPATQPGAGRAGRGRWWGR